jgi:cell division control protein 6
MKSKSVTNFLENFLKSNSLFVDKKFLQSNYTPESISHRDEQIHQIATILAPSLKMSKPSNLFIYGKTGTGKTLSVRYVANQIIALAEKNSTPVNIIYLNCKLKKIADTEYRLIAQLARELGKTIPMTGLPTEEVYKIFFNIVDEKKSLVILVLDEIDQLVKKVGDEILYNLTRINSELKQSQISIIGISNDLVFTDNLDPRVKSSLSEEEIVFPPYNALQIQDILHQRAEKSFKSGILQSGVIEKCAAYAAREHGDARRALELLRVAGELAERENGTKVELKHLDMAEEKIERDKVVDVVMTQPKQFQATLYSILLIHLQNKEFISTGEIYSVYSNLCAKTGLRPLTQRRVSDIIGEFDMLGIINARVTSKGRYGRTRDIALSIQPHIQARIQEILEKDLGLR